jgi:hypothetical protein
MEKVFPYTLGIVLFGAGVCGFLLLSGRWVDSFIQLCQKKKYKILAILQSLSSHQIQILVTIISFLVYLIPNAFIFVKWSRFMTPILPFFAIFSVGALNIISRAAGKRMLLLIGSLVYVPTILIGAGFFMLYVRPDPRFVASEWIYKNIPSNSIVLSETANVVDIPTFAKDTTLPINSYTLSPISFDLYNVDTNPELAHSLVTNLVKADYIFVPSRRIFANYLRFPERYPIVNTYYTNLFNGNLGFAKVAEISSYPSFCLLPIAFCQLPDEMAEETFTVFEHPVIRIYKKNISKTESDYQKILKFNP